MVERHNTFSHKKHDLFGGIDLVALDGQPGLLGIQATSASNAGARVEKLSQLDTMRTWLRAGNRLEVWGWSKRGKAQKRKLWTVRRLRASLDADGDLEWDDVEG